MKLRFGREAVAGDPVVGADAAPEGAGDQPQLGIDVDGAALTEQVWVDQRGEAGRIPLGGRRLALRGRQQDQHPGNFFS